MLFYCQAITHYKIPVGKIRPLLNRQFVKFLCAGGVNTLAGYIIYFVSILTGFPVWVSLAGSYVFGITFSFVVMGNWVFRSFGWARFPRFIVLHLSMYFINLKLIAMLSTMRGGALAAQAILILPIAVLTYVLLKRFVFRPARP